MASTLAKLLTYKFLTFTDIFDNLFSQSAPKLVLWTLLILLVICLPIYLLFRNTARESLLKDNGEDNYPEVYNLLDRWRTQNYWVLDKLIEICMAFVSGPPGSAMLPKNVQDIFYNPELSSPLSFELSQSPMFNANSVDFDEDAIDDEYYFVDRESSSSIQPNTMSSNKIATGELPSNFLSARESIEEATTPLVSGQHQHSRDNPPSSRSPSPAPQTEDMTTQNGDGSSTTETAESIEGGTGGMVVLAHNPGLKHKLASTHVRPPFQRSASDYEKEANAAAASEETGVDPHNVTERIGEAEPVPLDPIVHPPSSEMEDKLQPTAASNRPIATS
ncbi:unnamed protein product [Dibothriocephalus latus]|uniref:Uncharacterized protein n=1 Tax=Dibothriocephalus latus TaxID=60516 RepID=A0A3P7NGX0_DIBLA|nr:unnamed protein product [Dibothriocephalus latus]